MSRTTVIRPGLLVALRSSLTGGVSYNRVDLAHETDDARDVARWETTRTIEDPEEHKRAVQVRAKALGLIRKICAPTSFGLLCPLDQEAALDVARTEALALIEAHNREATYTRVGVYMLKGRIADSDEEAARAIGEEVAALVREMSSAIDRLDAEAIREAASRARALRTMLGDDQQGKIDDAISQARAAARAIVQRIDKDGENAAVVLADIQRGDLERARIAFLDYSEPVAAAPLPAVNVQRFADLDVTDVAAPTPAALTTPTPTIEV